MEGETLDIRAYWRILVRWWWVFVLAIVTAILLSSIATQAMTPVYKSQAKLLVQRGSDVRSPYMSDLAISQQLAKSYGDLIKTRAVLGGVVEQLALPYDVGLLSNKINVESTRSIIKITVSDQNPRLAAEIANTLAAIFIDDSISRSLAQIAQFQASLSQYGINQQTDIIAAQASTLSTLSMLEEGIPSANPYSPRPTLNMLVALVVGLTSAGIVVFLIEYMDSRIRSPEELNTLTEMPNLGSIPFYDEKDGSGPIISGSEHGHSAISEAYKFLRTNLEFAAVDANGFKTLLVTSSAPNEGKTTTAANLAISLAKDGDRVLLVDTDLRKPSIHKIFGVTNEKGLTNLILGNTTIDEAILNTNEENLSFLPAGPVPPNAPQLLRSSKMKEITDDFKKIKDIVIFDSPPLMSVTDPMLVASLVDGIILVFDADRTRRDMVKRGVELVRQSNPDVVGTVLNKITEKQRNYYYYYYSSYGAYGPYGVEPPKKQRFSQLSKLFQRWKKHKT